MSEQRAGGFDRREFLVQAAGAMAAVSLLPQVLPAAVRGDSPLRVGVVGVGRQGSAILDELAKIDTAKVLAVCDNDPRRLERAQRKLAGVAAFATHAEMLDKAKDLQAIIIATPTHLHRQIVLDGLAAGKHVYCEAPIAHTLEDSKAIAAAARGAKVVAAAGLEGRSDPVYKLARTFFRSDAVRDVVALRGQNFQKTTWRTPASDPARDKALNWRLDKELSLGLAGELGTHQFDVFCWYRDQYPASVGGSGAILLHADGREVHDTVSCEFAFADARRLHYEASLASSFQGRHEILHGTNATIKLAWTHGWMFKEADAPTQGWEVYANRQQFFNDEGITLIAEATKLADQGKLKEGVGLPNSPLYYALLDFVNAAVTGKAPGASLEVGHRATALGILAHQATLAGKTLDITKAALE